MKNCMLFLMAFLFFTKTHAQNDTVAVSSPGLLSFFHVQPVDNVILLKWSVKEEGEEFKGFDIERSEDGTNFIKVGSKLAISKNSTGDYDFVDATPKRNLALHYRLKLIYRDGAETFSEFKETKLADVQWAVKLKQNPVRNNIDVEVEASTVRQASVMVISNSGQQITKQAFRLSAGKNQLSFPTQGMVQGFYQLIVEVGNDRKTISFIKE